MNYNRVLKVFNIEWECIETLVGEDKPSVPLLHKNTSPLCWQESFKDCLYRTFGVRKTPLSYVIREEVVPESEAVDPLATVRLPGGNEIRRPYGSSGSVLDELITRLTHDSPLYQTDSALVYSMLEIATRGTIYASTVKPYSRHKNGRAAWL